MKRLAIAFSGPSNSGKTTLIVKIIKELQSKNQRVIVVKHDPSDKAVFDTKGKDSWKFSQTGCEVVVLSPTRTTYFSNENKDLDWVIKMLGDFDFLIIEGLKSLPLPRISVFRDEVDESYLKFSQAIATNLPNFNTNLPNFDIDDYKSICEWIENNAKKV